MCSPLVDLRGRERISEVRSEPAPELLLEVRARPGADDRLLPLTALEEDHRRNREHAELGRPRRVLVDVHLHEADLLPVLGLELVEHLLDTLARSAPGRPEVDEDGPVGAENLRGEALVRDLDHAISVDAPTTPARA